MSQFWDWIWPVLMLIVLAALAVYFYPWLVLQARRRLRHIDDMWRDLLFYALRWPFAIALSVAGIYLLTQNWPLSFAAREFFQRAEQIALIVLFVLLFQHWIVAAYRFSGEASWLKITFLRKLLLIAIYSIATLMIMDTVGMHIGALLVSLGIGSLAVGLALKDILANFFAGIQLSMERPLEPGQMITMENGMTAQVLWINWMNTHLRSLDGSLVIVPNSRLLGWVIQNQSLSDPLATVAVVLTIDRAADLDRAEQLALDAAREVMPATEISVPGPIQFPSARFTKLTATAAELTITLAAHDPAALADLRSAYLKKINTALNQAEIKLN